MAFGARYASVYDALNSEKNYAAEAEFVLDQIGFIGPDKPRQILDLGCGTGLHAIKLAECGISVTGVDRSVDMVAVAEKRKELLATEIRDRVLFEMGDIRTLDIGRQYDAVLALFHVMSYMTKDDDLDAAVQTARRHLKKGGAFLFDFWHGPAVLRDPPQARIRSFRQDESCINRTTTPEWDRQSRLVRVNFDIETTNIASGESIREQEQHIMRYFFPVELETLLGRFGFEVVRFGEWLTGGPPSDKTFGVYALAKAK